MFPCACISVVSWTEAYDQRVLVFTGVGHRGMRPRPEASVYGSASL